MSFGNKKKESCLAGLARGRKHVCRRPPEQALRRSDAPACPLPSEMGCRGGGSTAPQLRVETAGKSEEAAPGPFAGPSPPRWRRQPRPPHGTAAPAAPRAGARWSGGWCTSHQLQLETGLASRQRRVVCVPRFPPCTIILAPQNIPQPGRRASSIPDAP